METILTGNHSVIMIGHMSLKEITNQTIQSPEQQYYLTKLFVYDCMIVYKSRFNNKVADALS